MPNSAKRKLVVGATGLAVLAGAGGAYAAGQSGSGPAIQPGADRAAEQKAFLDDVAKRLNVSRAQLDAAIKGAAEARIDAAVAAGRLTKEQGEAAKKRLAAGVPLLAPGPLGGRPGHRGKLGGRGFGLGRGANGAAEYLGLTEAQLREQLRSGKSLADIARATSGKTVEGLKAAIKSGITAALDKAVADGRLTDAQRDRMVAQLDARIDTLVERTPRAGGPRHRWR
jgi:hypothetical protein